MKVCVIGSGPAALYTAKFLLSNYKNTLNQFQITMYEKLSKPGGLFKSAFFPEKYNPNLFKQIIENKNLKIKLNTEIKSLKKLENKYDAFVIATGAQKPRILNVPGNENIKQGLDVIKEFNCNKNANGDPISKKVLIVGCGNVAMDLIKHFIKFGSKTIHVLARSGPFNAPFTNSELRSVFDINNLKIKYNIDVSKETYNSSSKNERRKKLMLEPQNSINNNVKLKFYFYSNLLGTKRSDNKILTWIKEKDKIKLGGYDSVISAIGFQNNDKIFEKCTKPIFHVGWCKNPSGNLNDIRFDAQIVAHKIKQLFNNTKEKITG